MAPPHVLSLPHASMKSFSRWTPNVPVLSAHRTSNEHRITKPATSNYAQCFPSRNPFHCMDADDDIYEYCRAQNNAARVDNAYLDQSLSRVGWQLDQSPAVYYQHSPDAYKYRPYPQQSSPSSWNPLFDRHDPTPWRVDETSYLFNNFEPPARSTSKGIGKAEKPIKLESRISPFASVLACAEKTGISDPFKSGYRAPGASNSLENPFLPITPLAESKSPIHTSRDTRGHTRSSSRGPVDVKSVIEVTPNRHRFSRKPIACRITLPKGHPDSWVKKLSFKPPYSRRGLIDSYRPQYDDEYGRYDRYNTYRYPFYSESDNSRGDYNYGGFSRYPADKSTFHQYR